MGHQPLPRCIGTCSNFNDHDYLPFEFPHDQKYPWRVAMYQLVSEKNGDIISFLEKHITVSVINISQEFGLITQFVADWVIQYPNLVNFTFPQLSLEIKTLSRCPTQGEQGVWFLQIRKDTREQNLACFLSRIVSKSGSSLLVIALLAVW